MRRDFPAVVISHDAWRRDFARDPNVTGRVIHIGNRNARIAGVLPYGVWRLSRRAPMRWLLEPDSLLGLMRLRQHAWLPARAPLSTGTGLGCMASAVSITARGADYDDQQFYGVSFAGRLRGPWAIYQFALILALLALPAVTSVTLGESNYSSHRPSWKRTVLRRAFLLAKFVLVAAIAYFASLDLSWWNSPNYSPLAEFAQLVWAFSICLFGFRWALSDQRQHPPVCLRRVPSRAGGIRLAHFPRLERHGDDLHGRPHAAPRPQPAHKLV